MHRRSISNITGSLICSTIYDIKVIGLKDQLTPLINLEAVVITVRTPHQYHCKDNFLPNPLRRPNGHKNIINIF